MVVGSEDHLEQNPSHGWADGGDGVDVCGVVCSGRLELTGGQDEPVARLGMFSLQLQTRTAGGEDGH